MVTLQEYNLKNNLVNSIMNGTIVHIVILISFNLDFHTLRFDLDLYRPKN